MSPVHDVSAWPLVVVPLSAEGMTDAEFAADLDRHSAYFERGERHRIVQHGKST